MFGWGLGNDGETPRLPVVGGGRPGGGGEDLFDQCRWHWIGLVTADGAAGLEEFQVVGHGEWLLGTGQPGFDGAARIGVGGNGRFVSLPHNFIQHPFDKINFRLRIKPVR